MSLCVKSAERSQEQLNLTNIMSNIEEHKKKEEIIKDWNKQADDLLNGIPQEPMESE